MRGLGIRLCGLSLLCLSLPAICGAEHLIYIQLSTQTHLSNKRDPVSKQNSHCKCSVMPPKETTACQIVQNEKKRYMTLTVKTQNSQLQPGLRESFIPYNHFSGAAARFLFPFAAQEEKATSLRCCTHRLQCGAVEIKKSAPEKYDCNVNELKSSPLSD